MKNLILISIFILQINMIFAQFGGGNGTIQSPYEIYTIHHLEELQDSLLTNGTTNSNFRLMNDITDSLDFCLGYSNTTSGIFNGKFMGCGHFINIKTRYDENERTLFSALSNDSHVDSLILYGNCNLWQGISQYNSGIISNCINYIPINDLFLQSSAISGICIENYGLIENCINNADVYANIASPICFSNFGVIRHCVNNGNIQAVVVDGWTSCSGIVYYSSNSPFDYGLYNCINNGNIEVMGIAPFSVIAGICTVLFYGETDSIYNCINNGNIDGKQTNYCAGVVASGAGAINNCINNGNISGGSFTGGIIGSIMEFLRISNCFNTGKIISNGLEGGILGYLIPYTHTNSITVLKNNLNIGNVTQYSIIGDTDPTIYQNPEIILENNYYDKQIVTQQATVIGDIPGQAEGKLTSELTGTGTQLQQMLGSGWSYAEGRYPIPLGLENDSSALLAATPMFLHYTDQNNYNSIDSVSENFTVGLENNVSWQVTGNKVTLNGQNATLQNTGYEILTVTLDGYSKSIQINIKNSNPPEIPTYTISGYVTSNSQALENVTISYSGGSTITNNLGFYTFETNEHSDQTIFPSLTGYVFTPPDTTINDITQNIDNVNFTTNQIYIPTTEQSRSANIYVFQNPTSENTSLNISNYKGKINCQIFDIQGKIIFEKDIIVDNKTVEDLPTQNLISGIYLVKVKTNSEVFNIKLFKK